MTDDAGNLSIDFLAGFTIFMIALIYVATLIPGLFIGLESQTIDYDAVAYRTGVILAEDPGMPDNPAWETFPDERRDEVLRFGLAISKDHPNILMPQKVDRFFCSTWSYDDYRSRAVFGDYPYKYNISLKVEGEPVIRSTGEEKPDGYGYIRRVVKVKGTSNATIDHEKVSKYDYISHDNVTNDVFSIHINCTELLHNETIKNPVYQINPLKDQIMINITDLDQMGNTSINTSLTDITIYRIKPISSNSPLRLAPIRTFDTPYIDSETSSVSGLPVKVTKNITMIFPPGFFSDFADDTTQLYVFLNFTHDSWKQNYLNNTWNEGPWNVSKSFEYDYNPVNVTQPELKDGVLEVAVW
ncbi:MAG TPA: hypothetical protein PKM50_07095 [Methanoregula sp.]|nr:hypothetical protein [Methanoregula sp.]